MEIRAVAFGLQPRCRWRHRFFWCRSGVPFRGNPVVPSCGGGRRAEWSPML